MSDELIAMFFATAVALGAMYTTSAAPSPSAAPMMTVATTTLF